MKYVRSLYSIRIFVHGVVTFPFFDTFIMLVIVASSVTLAAEDPVRENSERNHILTYFDYGFTGIFAIEMFLKVSFYPSHSQRRARTIARARPSLGH